LYVLTTKEKKMIGDELKERTMFIFVLHLAISQMQKLRKEHDMNEIIEYL
jgi:hypothetical protein